MTVTIIPSKLNGTVKAPPSKSQAHRLLICSALADTETYVGCDALSRDIEATARCLDSLCADVSFGNGFIMVVPRRDKTAGEVCRLDCGESGSTLRFLLPVVCALGVGAIMTGDGRLPERPLSPLYEQLVSHGCDLRGYGPVSGTQLQKYLPLEIGGKLCGGDFEIAGNVSSQFISGLLFALPLVEGGGSVSVTGNVESKPYIDMTVTALENFGIKTICEENRYTVVGDRRYVSPEKIDTEGDWSNAAFWLAAGAVASDMGTTCVSLNRRSPQGDKKIVSLLRGFGADIVETEKSITVKPSQLHAVDIDASDIPDLVPILAVTACAAHGTTVIYNAGRLRLKESDRLKSITETLGALGADIREGNLNGSIKITGGKKLSGGVVSACSDHRIAMSLAIASAMCEEPVVITGAEATAKSYPDFFGVFKAMGGKITV